MIGTWKYETNVSSFPFLISIVLYYKQTFPSFLPMSLAVTVTFLEIRFCAAI
jgi:hypothetical protein